LSGEGAPSAVWVRPAEILHFQFSFRPPVPILHGQNVFPACDRAGAQRLAGQQHLLHKPAPALVPAEDWFSNPRLTGGELPPLIILCCNEVDVTRQCLESVLHHTRAPYALILVGNGSTDGTEIQPCSRWQSEASASLLLTWLPRGKLNHVLSLSFWTGTITSAVNVLRAPAGTACSSWRPTGRRTTP
jgi:hypothetical protein